MVNFQRTEPDKSRAPRRCKHLVSMAVDLHIAPDLCDPAVCADQNRRAKNSLEGPAIHGFLSPGPVSLQHLMLFVRNKRYGKPVLVSKGFLCLWRIGGNAQYRGPAFGEGARQPREIDGLPGTAGRVGARIEKQHELCSGIVRSESAEMPSIAVRHSAKALASRVKSMASLVQPGVSARG